MTALTGVVVEVHGSRAMVLLDDSSGTRIRCRPPRDRTTPVAGDRVEIRKEREDWLIDGVVQRHRCLWRPHRRGRQLLAANVDLLVILAAPAPPLKRGLIDRFLVAAELESIPSMIVINKSDLPEIDAALELAAPYRMAGYEVIALSAQTGDGCEDLVPRLTTGVSIVVGASGVGKSTLLNRLLPGADIKTQALSHATGHGRHTTSVSTSHEFGGPWPEGGLIVDTPGVRRFALHGVELQRIATAFPDFRSQLGKCWFRDCLHLDEPDCAVRNAVDSDVIAPERYEGYLNIVESLQLDDG